MRALVLKDFWDLAVEERPDPVPEPGEALVRVLATGICGTDVHGFTGENGRRSAGQVMGHETVGVVESAEKGGPEPGALVTINPVLYCGNCSACNRGEQQNCPNKLVLGVTPQRSAAFAELITAPVRNLATLPEGMPAEYGALVEPLSVGYHALRRGQAVADDAVLILGGGPIGQACILAARRLGVESVAVSEPDPHRRELCTTLGAMALDPGEGSLRDRVAETLGREPTLAVDAVGATATMTDALTATCPTARVVLVGMATPDLRLPAYSISTEERSIAGSFCYSARDFADTAEWVGQAPPELAHLIEGRVDLESAQTAFTALAKGESEASKVLVFPQDGEQR